MRSSLLTSHLQAFYERFVKRASHGSLPVKAQPMPHSHSRARSRLTHTSLMPHSHLIPTYLSHRCPSLTPTVHLTAVLAGRSGVGMAHAHRTQGAAVELLRLRDRLRPAARGLRTQRQVRAGAAAGAGRGGRDGSSGGGGRRGCGGAQPRGTRGTGQAARGGGACLLLARATRLLARREWCARRARGAACGAGGAAPLAPPSDARAAGRAASK